MRHGSLFSGIGGFDLAAECMGWENVFHCEINKYCRELLNQKWPLAKSYGDIKQTDFTIHRGGIDILTGGFPCQPYSVAGERRGKEDDRHLWPYFLKTIRDIKPAWVVGENVRGIIGWNGGVVFDEVQAELEAEGFKVQAFLLPAAGVNAPHRRERVWFVAYSNFNRGELRKLRSGTNHIGEWNVLQNEFQGAKVRGPVTGCGNASANSYSDGRRRAHQFQKNNNRGLQEGMEERHELDPLHGCRSNSNSNNEGLQRSSEFRITTGGGAQSNEQPSGLLRSDWKEFPTQPPVCGRNDGISNRVDRIKALGNAVVPQVVYQIFKAIQKYEQIQS